MAGLKNSPRSVPADRAFSTTGGGTRGINACRTIAAALPPADGSPRGTTLWRTFALAPILTVLIPVLGATSPALANTVEPGIEQLRALRVVLEAYEDVDAALADGFEQFGTCMDSGQGAQGIHFVHPERIADPAIDALVPEVLMYEPRPDGTLRLIGAELLVFQEDWHATGVAAVPTAFGQELGINMTLLDAPFYMLHLWIWQYNPLGFYANWNPLVTCEHEAGEGHGH